MKGGNIGKLSCPSWSFCQPLPVSLPTSSDSLWHDWNEMCDRQITLVTLFTFWFMCWMANSFHHAIWCSKTGAAGTAEISLILSYGFFPALTSQLPEWCKDGKFSVREKTGCTHYLLISLSHLVTIMIILLCKKIREFLPNDTSCQCFSRTSVKIVIVTSGLPNLCEEQKHAWSSLKRIVQLPCWLFLFNLQILLKRQWSDLWTVAIFVCFTCCCEVTCKFSFVNLQGSANSPVWQARSLGWRLWTSRRVPQS